MSAFHRMTMSMPMRFRVIVMVALQRYIDTGQEAENERLNECR